MATLAGNVVSPQRLEPAQETALITGATPWEANLSALARMSENWELSALSQKSCLPHWALPMPQGMS